MIGLHLRTAATRASPAAWAAPGSLLDLDFGRDRYARSRRPRSRAAIAAFTRPSAAGWFAADGVTAMAQAASGVLRRDSRGALLEAPLAAGPVNSQLVGAVAGTPGTLPTGAAYGSAASGATRSIALPASPYGFPVMDISWDGVVSGAVTSHNVQLNAAGSFAVSPGQTVFAQMFAQVLRDDGLLSAGNAFRSVVIAWRDANGVFITSAFGDNTATRADARFYSVVATAPAGTASATIAMQGNSVAIGQTMARTIRLGAPMLARIDGTAFAPATSGTILSPILTTNSGAVTRATESLTAPLSVHAAGTIVIIAERPSFLPASGGLVSLHETSITSANTQFLRLSGATLQWANSGGTGSAAVSFAGVSAGQRFCVAARWGSGSCGISLNGGTVATGAGYAAPGPSAALASIGGGGFGTNPWCDFIERVIVFPDDRGDAALPGLSTLAAWGG